MTKRVLVAITGASGAIYGVRLVKALKTLDAEIHLVVSRWGAETLKFETGMTASALKQEADMVYREDDLTAGPASGSFDLDAMVVIPCSMKTLAGIAHGYADNLIARAADCALKERRKLILVPRETPLNLIHIRNMAIVTEAGAVVIPASPSFWSKPQTVEELVDSVVERVIAHIGLFQDNAAKWDETGQSQ
ncbi:MAG: UbiX family flavin prenyltransferase [Candidatus Thorarchaeota archaeon]|nr:MAG: aromatic acid decarboxylase [Candidatus Thorarchaeota archaeon]RLI56341.1 MAG: aromatic acid decarboxylase [Candidatus Thorarchaeota archaeon]